MVTLSVLTMALTILGVVIAVVAVWGYRGIREESRKLAEIAARDQIMTFLDSQQIQDKLKEEVSKRVSEQADELFRELYFSFSSPRSPLAAGSETVTGQYPSGEEGS